MPLRSPGYVTRADTPGGKAARDMDGLRTGMDPDKDKKQKDMTRGSHRGGTRKAAPPGWAAGLRQLYDSVVDEPLPDSFKDLLSKLDDKRA